MDRGKVIGIDLGTTYSCAAVWQHDRFEMIVNEQGNRNTPSMVAFNPLERLVGDAARNQVSTNPQNTVFHAKRLIGRRFNDPSVQSDMLHWPFTVVEGNNGWPIIQVDYKGETKCFTAEEISSMVLRKMKKIAEEFLNCEVKNAVISVPAYFNNCQRRATKDAAKLAGLNVMRIINEPTAAAIAYGFHTDVYFSNTKKTIVVFDLGGGTFDVSILNVHGGEFQVKAVGGDTRLGGEDFNNRLVNHCVQHFNTKHNKQLNSNARALWKLRSECERAKRTLSSALETVIAIDYLYEGKDFEMKITREKFEELNRELFEQTIQIVKGCLQDAKISAEQIDDVVLAGGSTRIPMVQHLLEQLFPGKLYKTINPDESIAYGAAAFAAALNSEEVKLVVEDVTALSLGIQVNRDMMDIVVPKNTPLPTRMEKRFSTGEDNQVIFNFQVSEGERALTLDGTEDGKRAVTFDNFLEGIRAAGAGVRQIKVVFEVDEDGILKVSARDEGSGVNNAITINHDSNPLRVQEIEGSFSRAEKFRRQEVFSGAESKKKRRVVKAKLANFIYNMKNRLQRCVVKAKLANFINMKNRLKRDR